MMLRLLRILMTTMFSFSNDKHKFSCSKCNITGFVIFCVLFNMIYQNIYSNNVSKYQYVLHSYYYPAKACIPGKCMASKQVALIPV